MLSEVPDEKYTEIASHGWSLSFQTPIAILRFVSILSKSVFSASTPDTPEIMLAVKAARMKQKKKISDIIVINIHKLSYHKCNKLILNFLPL